MDIIPLGDCPEIVLSVFGTVPTWQTNEPVRWVRD